MSAENAVDSLDEHAGEGHDDSFESNKSYQPLPDVWKELLKLGRTPNNILLERFDFAYMAVPKAGNSSVKVALLPAIDRSPDDVVLGAHVDKIIHKRNAGIFEYVNREAVAAARPSLCLTVVRNTWDRVASCYNNKVSLHLHAPFKTYGFTQKMTFRDFAKAVALIDDSVAEIHFRSQSSLLFLGQRYLPNLTLHLDHLEQGWRLVQTHFSSFGVALPDIPVVNKKSSAPPSSFYTKETIEIVRRRYAKEIEFFGFEPPALPAKK